MTDIHTLLFGVSFLYLLYLYSHNEFLGGEK